MTWTAGATKSTGDLIDAATWNNYMGAAGSIEYLKTELETVTQNDVTGSRAIDGTVYQNTTCITKIVTVSVELNQEDDDEISAYVENDATPAVRVGMVGSSEIIDATIVVPITFVVPSSWYYKVDNTSGTPALVEWFEWDLH